MLDITTRCNLRCPVCFASAGEAQDSDPPLAALGRLLADLHARSPQVNVQLSGGEPTVRDDLPEIIALTRATGFGFVQVNTNGIRPGRDPDYAHHLAAAGLDCVFLQFDTLDGAACKAIRGLDLVAVKQAAIEHCRRARLGVVLVPTLLPGVNLQEVGAPVRGPNGELLGVMDISGDERKHYLHSLGLVRAAAQTLENRLFESCHSQHIRQHFHPLGEGIGTFSEGAVALSESGWIIGATPAGLLQLGLTNADLGVSPITRVLRLRWEDVIDLCRRQPGEPQLIARSNGGRLFVRVEAGARPVITCPPQPVPRPADALATIDYGDEAMAALISKARKLIGTPIAVLLQGEPGVGKAYFARALHASGPRHTGPFVSINCGAVQDHLLEAELFGHVPPVGGEEWPGRLREADGGTLYIEEIADLPLPLQTRLLDVIQKKQLTPLGGAPRPIDFVLICATTRQIKAEVETGRFRADLYYHISAMTLRCPPLRERQDFEVLLARRLKDLSPERDRSLEPELALAFANYTWPGNITQLSNVLRAACALLEADENRIGWQHLPDNLVEELRWQTPANAPADEPESLRELSKSTMARAIALSHGNMSEAARRLGISRNTLYRHMRRQEEDKGEEE